ncbi:FtsX-like permease family protein [Candidatus Lokiarchaeum ossiferum]|uniref:FtsX-like permease family protein n=1 Tax=Candidatus Lokiarchaeum ossiferum TaxID=2951803 RepID=UPI00352D1779
MVPKTIYRVFFPKKVKGVVKIRSRISYYIKRAYHSTRSNILIIIAFSLTISVIFGLNIYSLSYERELLDRKLTNVVDFTVDVSADSYNGTAAFAKNQEKIVSAKKMVEERDMELDQLFDYGCFHSEFLKIALNRSLPFDPTEESQLSVLPFSVIQIENSFYQSDRFNSFFTLLEGRLPLSSNEIILDISYMEYFNITLDGYQDLSICLEKNLQDFEQFFDSYGDPTTIHPLKSTFFNENYNGVYLNSTIVGVYASNKVQYRFLTKNFEVNYHYDLKTGAIEYTQEFPESAPILTVHNFSSPNDKFAYQELIYQFDQTVDSNPLTHVSEAFFGFFGIINRNSVGFHNYNAFSKQLKSEDNVIETNLPDSFEITSILYPIMKKVYLDTLFLRGVLIVLSIPLIIAAILFGSFARKTEVTSRAEEFLLLRSKGAPPRMTFIEFLYENSLIGIISSTISLIFGIFFFYAFKQFFTGILVYSNFLKPAVNLSIILQIIAFGQLLSLVGSLSALKSILDIDVGKVLGQIGSEDFEVEFNEKTLTTKGKAESEDSNSISNRDLVDSENKIIEEQAALSQGNIKRNLKRKQKKKKEQKEEAKEFEKIKELKQRMVYGENFALLTKKDENLRKMGLDSITKKAAPIKRKRKPIKYSFLLIFGSFIPTCLYLFIYFSKSRIMSDSLTEAVEFLQQDSMFVALNVIVVISPIFLVWGILRLITVEFPTLFSKSSQKIAQLFIKERSFLVGIEMLRRKQYKILILVLALFSSLFSFSNIYLNSNARYNYLSENYIVGADVTATFHKYSENITTISDLDNLENTLMNYQVPETDKYLINNVLSYYKEDYDVNNPDWSIYVIEFEKYFNIVGENNKKYPSSAFKQSFTEAIKYNDDFLNLEEQTTRETQDENQRSTKGEPSMEDLFDIPLSSCQVPGIIVNDLFLEHNYVRVGDLIDIKHRSYDLETHTPYFSKLRCRILSSLNIFPGLFTEYTYQTKFDEVILFDASFLQIPNFCLPSSHIYQMIDIDLTVESDPKILEAYIENCTSGFSTLYKNMDFYDQDFRMLEIGTSLDIIGFYTVLYIDFIIVGILIAFGLSIVLIALEREKKYFNGVLLARGFGKKGLLSLILTELFVIFFIALLFGLSIGVIFSTVLVKIDRTLDISKSAIDLPIFINLLDLVGIFSLIIGLSFGISYLIFRNEARKKISTFFHKF